jgi:hypothetical protein
MLSAFRAPPQADRLAPLTRAAIGARLAYLSSLAETGLKASTSRRDAARS